MGLKTQGRPYRHCSQILINSVSHFSRVHIFYFYHDFFCWGSQNVSLLRAAYRYLIKYFSKISWKCKKILRATSLTHNSPVFLFIGHRCRRKCSVNLILFVCWSICLSVRPSVHLFVHLFIYLSICSSARPSVHLFVHLFIFSSICSSVCPSVHLFVHLFVCSTICSSVRPSVHSLVYLLICLSICSSVCPSVCLFVHLFICSSICSQRKISELAHHLFA